MMKLLKKILITCFLGCAIPGTAECPLELELFYSPYCFFSLKVLHYLDSIHKTVSLRNVAENQEIREELILRGGKAQVPCLMMDDQALYESDLIVEWLEENKDCLTENSGGP